MSRLLLTLILICGLIPKCFSVTKLTTTENYLKEARCFILNGTNGCDALQNFALESNVSRTTIADLVCRSNTFLSFTWSRIESDVFYLIEFKIENSVWNYHEITRSPLTVLKNLSEDTFHQMRVWILTKNATVLGSFLSESIKTYGLRDVPREVDGVKIKEMQLQDNYYYAVVNWMPAEGDRSCLYEVLWMNNFDYQVIDVDSTSGLFEAIVGPLEFDSTYPVFIMSKSERDGNESNKTQLTINTPNCLEVLKNLSVCVPETPINLQSVSRKNRNNLHDIEVTWLKPNLTPDYYLLELDNHPNGNNFNLTQLNVSGEMDKATFVNIVLEKEYEILAIAASSAGQSYPAIIKNYVVDNEKNLIELWIIIVVSVVLVVAFALILLYVKLVRRTKIEIASKQIQQTQEIVSGIMPLVHDKWEIDTSQLSIGMVLGNGAFGIVRKGWLKKSDGAFEEVAVKTLNDNSTEEDKKQFLSEIEIMKSVGIHRHLVSLLGCNTTGFVPILIVEYCSNGDLKTYLQNAWNFLTELHANCFVEDDYENLSKNVSNKLYDIDNKNIPTPLDLLSFARQIAIGMEYLSSLHVLHRDLAARNILICDDGIVKVSDFGLSRDVYRDNVYYKSSNGKLPIRWMAIESLTHQIYTTQSDVWSYGILLWEIITLGANPYPGIATQELLKLLENDYRMERPSGCSDELYDLMRNCWQKNPKERQTFTNLIQTLDIIMEDSTQYLLLDNIHKVTQGDETISEKLVKENDTVNVERYVRP